MAPPTARQRVGQSCVSGLAHDQRWWHTGHRTTTRYRDREITRARVALHLSHRIGSRGLRRRSIWGVRERFRGGVVSEIAHMWNAEATIVPDSRHTASCIVQGHRVDNRRLVDEAVAGAAPPSAIGAPRAPLAPGATSSKRQRHPDLGVPGVPLFRSKRAAMPRARLGVGPPDEAGRLSKARGRAGSPSLGRNTRNHRDPRRARDPHDARTPPAAPETSPGPGSSERAQ
jgi:hypothetical protein